MTEDLNHNISLPYTYATKNCSNKWIIADP